MGRGAAEAQTWHGEVSHGLACWTMTPGPHFIFSVTHSQLISSCLLGVHYPLPRPLKGPLHFERAVSCTWATSPGTRTLQEHGMHFP